MQKTNITALALSLVVASAACHRDQAPMTPTPPDWLDGAIEEQASQLAPGSVRVGDLFKGTAYDDGDRQQWTITLSGAGCIYLSGVGDQSVEKLSLYLWGPDGERLETTRGDTARTLLTYCPQGPAQGTYKFEAKVADGHGHFAVGLYAQGDPNQPAAPAEPVAKKAKTGKGDKPAKPAANLDGEVVALAKSSAPGADKVGDSFSGDAGSTDWYVALEQGKCYWFVGAGDDSVEKLSLFLWDPSDKRVKASNSETNRVTVGHCPPTGGMYHMRAQVQGGGGEYKVGVFAKKN
jgi:hypothetical protein